MTKRTTETSKTIETSKTNPFEFAAVTNDVKTRKLAYTDVLNSTANARAHELMTGSMTQEQRELANTMMDGNPSDLVQLINDVFGEQTVATDAAVLDGCDPDQLKKLLESRRSERSTSKKKGIRSSAINCKTYISAMYAELMIRVQLNAPYAGSSNTTATLDESDLEAVARKVKSLQSKKCRLKKLAGYDSAAQTELEETEAEIDRLNALRPATVIKTKQVVKDLGVDQLREVLKSIDPATLPESERKKFENLMSKLA